MHVFAQPPTLACFVDCAVQASAITARGSNSCQNGKLRESYLTPIKRRRRFDGYPLTPCPVSPPREHSPRLRPCALTIHYGELVDALSRHCEVDVYDDGGRALRCSETISGSNFRAPPWTHPLFRPLSARDQSDCFQAIDRPLIALGCLRS